MSKKKPVYADPPAPALVPLRKGDKFFCLGCGKKKAYESKGRCAQCNARDRKERQAKVAFPADTQPVTLLPRAPDLPVAPPPPPEISATFGQVKNSKGDMEMFGATDPLLLELIDRMVMAVERRLLEDVSGMPFDVAAIHIVKAVETMARRVA